MTRTVRVLATGLGFTEGPVVGPDGELFVTSIDHGKVYRLDGQGGASLYGDVQGGANGATLGADGTLYVAQNGGRWARNGPRWRPDSVGGIQAIDPDGTVRWVTQEPIAPNDLCLGPDGLLYVTDPTRAFQAADGRLWRVDPADGATELLRSVRWFPNGIAFGPDDSLYVAATHTAQILRVDVATGAEEVVVQMVDGKPDGFAFDADSNLVIAAISEEQTPGSLQTWSLQGELVDTFAVSDSPLCTNVAFTADGVLIVADSSAERVLAVDGWGPGLALHPFR